MDDELFKKLEAARTLLCANGYNVTLKPICNQYLGHGKHVLKTSVEYCNGKEPIPHGHEKAISGGLYVVCRCGIRFCNYKLKDSPHYMTPWEKHVDEYIHKNPNIITDED